MGTVKKIKAKNLYFVTPQLRGLIVIPDLTRLGEASGVAWVGNPEKSILDSRFRGNDSIDAHNLLPCS